jgi:hypothetical protein
MNPTIRSLASKLKFAIGLNPKVSRTVDYPHFIPEPYKAVSLICADYDEQEFANIMQKVISEPVEANRMARESYKTGSVVFNYKKYTNSLINLFIKS